MSGKICEVGNKGTLLPLGGDGEQEWPKAIRIILYGMGLGWLFLGVAIIADRFMGAIEVITAKKARKFNAKMNRWYTVEVWNPTVANLTLMALGSSAPEILLSVIELFSNEIFSGDLGPSTIVGSAAFNLLVIIAVCVSSIPDEESRKIKEMPVYVVTAIFSVFAYLWLLIILLGPSKNVVEPWEGILTFLFFPLLVCTAFLADRGYFSGRAPAMGNAVVLSSDMTKEELAEVDARIRKEYGADLTPAQVTKIALIESGESKSRAQYRVAATRALTGGKRIQLADAASLLKKRFSGDFGDKLMKANQKKRSSLDGIKVVPTDDSTAAPEKPKTTMEFSPAGYAVMENAGKVTLTVKRHGEMGTASTVQYVTRPGQALAESDYVHSQGSLKFAPQEDRQTIEVGIIDDVSYEEDKEFFVDLYDPRIASGGTDDVAELGDKKVAMVVIIDDDMPGVISFGSDTLHVKESLEDQEVEVTVDRKNGCSGKVTVHYRTEQAGAVEGKDFEPLDDTLVFEHGETQARFKLKVKGMGRYERTEEFRVVLNNITGGATFNKDTDGGEASCILTVIIESEAAAKERVDRMMSVLAVNWDKAKIGSTNWMEQFRAALYVNGGEDDEGDGEDSGPPSVLDWVLHVVTLPWKLLFALVPPTDFCGGWVCFGCSLGMIGLVTAIINDMASLFGCVLGLPDDVTAITFVALGTSLPDTFASMVAAKQDAWADASIGNVTGSNSVNVFLGLGLPWMIGAIYWRSGTPSQKWITKYADDADIPAAFRDGAFVVKAGTLSFSVIIFCTCAAVCLLIIHIRRVTGIGELGGPKNIKYATSAAMVSLWLLYVGLSTWKSFDSQ